MESMDFFLKPEYQTPLLRFSFCLGYIFMGIYWLIHTFKHRKLTNDVPLNAAIGTMILLCISEQLLNGISILAAVLDVGPLPNLVLFISNLVFLWSVSYKFIVFMMIAKGWCITQLTLVPNAKQLVILTGASMMLIEVLLIGAKDIYAYFLIIAYVICLRVFWIETLRTITEAKVQIEILRVELVNYQSQGNFTAQVVQVILRKIKLLRQFLSIINALLLGKIAMVACRILVKDYYIFIASETWNLVILGLFTHFFRFRRPIVIHLQLTPDGQLVIASSQEEKTKPLEKVCGNLSRSW
jgi:hypothetical protein